MTTLSPSADSCQADMIPRSIDIFFSLLGWLYAKEGKKSMAYSEAFSALGVCFVISDMHLGHVTIYNIEQRINQLQSSITAFLVSGQISRSEALRFRGQMQFTCGQIFGRQFRLYLATLTDFAYGSEIPCMPPACANALEELRWMFPHAEPREVKNE